PAGEKLVYHYTNEENGLVLLRYWTNACQSCAIKQRCTTGKERRIARWKHEDVLEAVQKRLDRNPNAMRQRRETAEHPFGTLKMRGGDALPNEAPAKGRYRNGVTRTGLHPHQSDEYYGRSAADGRDPSIVKLEKQLASPPRPVPALGARCF